MSEGNYGKMRVLVLDDEEAITKLVEVVLKRIGIGHVVCAQDAQKAMAHFSGSTPPFDLVICDVVMPGMDGMTFLKQVKAKHPKLSFIMLTSKTAQQDFDAAKNAGATYYFMKPFQTNMLQTRIKAALDVLAKS